VSTTVPATYDAAGIDAIPEAEIKTIGFVTSPGGFPRPVRSFGSEPLLAGSTIYFARSETMETLSPEFVFRPESDEGQAILDANSNGQTRLTFIYDFNSGYRVVCVGLATGFTPVISDVEGLLKAQVSIQPLFSKDDVGVVRYTPASPDPVT
jgi:hypothetical protein